ncbi:ComF family protein [Neobittarella massiliensis]|uniref:ComF family protein n=1 Tax=Neobittarella massiliensis (ex Bilen et al. 2018) TaxID=2041842 RepID=UPI000CF744A1|nr:phosphoribosyltransferase family protein [Neobittarella massiliensis]
MICPDCDLQKSRLSDTINQRGIFAYFGRTLPYVEKDVAPFIYRGEVQRALGRYKFSGRAGSGRALAVYMAACARAHLPLGDIAAVTAVPMSPQKRRQKGYDHAAVLARQLASQLGLPFWGDLLKKIYPTAAQHTLPKLARSANLLGAFEVKDPQRVRGRAVLLVDDILTTGATAGECAKMLRVRGCRQVYLCCAAAALQKGDKLPDGA